MPQKKNPDMAELIRGKSGRVYGNLFGLLTVMKSLPLAYNKDLQEDKEGLFDAIDTIKFSLAVYAAMIRGLRVRQEKMEQAVRHDFSNATDMADYLVKKALPFRQAHEVVGKTVRYCIEQEKWLMDLSIAEFQQFSPLFEEDILEAIKVETCVENRNSFGGTSPAQVKLAMEAAEEIIRKQQSFLDMYTKNDI